MFKPKKIRVAMAAWEIGRVNSGLGVKVGGLGSIIEELPAELVKAAAKQDILLEVEVLTPCFAHYDKSRLTKLDLDLPVTLEGDTFSFEAFEHVFADGQKVIYFWDDWQLSWTNSAAIYPSDPQMSLRLYSSVSQAMASYIKQKQFNTVHIHDYHVGLLPLYLGDECLKEIPVHFTIHNATYQGVIPLYDGGYSLIDRIDLSGQKLFHKYFDFFDNLNLMKACMLKVHENGGKITTVSGDLQGSWGYAAELKLGHKAISEKAQAQKGSPPGEVFVPNRHLDLFEKLPITGITNGLSIRNQPEALPELKARVLQKMQAQREPDDHLFRHPTTQEEMLAQDHNFDPDNLQIKAELKRLLHLETFWTEPVDDPILITAVGRLVDQKNLGLVADIIERTLIHDAGTKFIILASASENDGHGLATESNFFRLAAIYPNRVYFNNSFNVPLSKLILTGGDFMLIPSRFEPCGLVDYEASLVGNVVIGRATGGLTKVNECAYLYDWLDISDRVGEADAFFGQIRAAIDTYRHDRDRHDTLIQKAMSIDASWDKSAQQYVDMYRYGFIHKKWSAARKSAVRQFAKTIDDDKELFVDFFTPGYEEYGDRLDWELKQTLLDADE